MGTLRDWFMGTKIDALPVKATSYETVNPNPLITVTSTGQEITIDLSELIGATPAQMFRTQPYLRSVVSFLARNIAQLGLHTYRKVNDLNRERESDSVTAQLIRKPNDYTTRYELLDALVSDLALWDQAFWWISPDNKLASGWRITYLPVAWVDVPWGGDYFEPDTWRVTRPGRPTIEIPARDVIHFHGWNPEYLHRGVSPVMTLKDILKEQVTAVIYRQQRWERGARVGYVITRPEGAPRWSPETEERFRNEWKEKFQSDRGSEAGGTPILQDGMTLTKMGFSAVEDEFVEASKLALTTVAAVYHVNPTMVGLLDNANYSNVREFRRMLYGDTLGPWLSMIEDRINGFLVPRIEGEDSGLYVEFNINEKLQGSFEEQAQVASMAVGGPYMTRNEYRARQNLPPIDGGDELIVPMNVVTGGQPSPQTPLAAPIRLAQVVEPTFRDVQGGLVGVHRAPAPHSLASSTTRGKPPRAKARASDSQHQRTAQVLRQYYDRQARVVLPQLSEKSGSFKSGASWWNEDRWNAELTTDLLAVAMKVSEEIGTDAMAGLGAPDPYDPERTVEFLTAVMSQRAESINQATKDQIDSALTAQAEADPEDEDVPSPEDVFGDDLLDQRSEIGAVTILTTVASFAVTEAGKQAAPGGGAMKTWVVNSPKSRHPEMDGETVPVDDVFSNGAQWPGDASLGPDETSGCQCEVTISIP